MNNINEELVKCSSGLQLDLFEDIQSSLGEYLRGKLWLFYSRHYAYLHNTGSFSVTISNRVAQHGKH